MALVNPNIAMSFRQPEFTPRNALAEYAQIQQIQGGQRQAEIADMQLRRMRQEDEDIERIHQIAMKNGGPDSRMEMGRALFASRNPTQRELGYKILQHEEAKTAFKAAEAQFGYAPGAAAAAAPAMPSSVPGAMAAPSTPAEPETGIDSYGKPYEAARPNAIAPPAGVMRGIAPGGGMGAEMPLAPANALAPPAAAPVNAMLASAAPLAPAAATPTKGKTLEQLQREYMAYSSLEKLGAPGAAGRLKIIEQQMEDARKAFEVKGRLITRDGTVLYESPADPTNIAILEREVAALLKGGALPTDPRIAVRQSAIAQAAGQNTELMRNYSAAKAQGFRGTIFDYERQIKEAGRAPRQEPPPQPPVAVVDPATGKQVLVSREEALTGRMTPAAAMESLPPKEMQKREAAFPQATSAVKGIESKATGFIKDLEALRDHPGLSSITGIAAGRLPGITAQGRAAQALYDKIVAKGGFQALQEMRDASKTGGALGNVSNQEGTQLKASFAAIDRRQEAKDVQKAIAEAIEDIQRTTVRMREAYDSTYSYKSGGGAAPAAPNIDALLNKYK